ncbi:TylF/MycF/NovP-related O-methyltransferase [Marinobacter sp. C1S70]|uniref:TylF/MycF/NovP-related O-methyltransferase n=1 Tax=Marinobacter sp. C1S70 TaxID=1396859 RepID=UPI0039B6EB5E
MISGDILQTAPAFLSENPHIRVALLHIDLDVYSPSRLALDLFYPRMVSGGLIVLDDYGTVEGETVAVEEFLSDKNLKLKKLPLTNT